MGGRGQGGEEILDKTSLEFPRKHQEWEWLVVFHAHVRNEKLPSTPLGSMAGLGIQLTSDR